MRPNKNSGGSFSLSKKIFFTIFLLIIYRLGTYIPLPGINFIALSDILKTHSSGVLGVFNVFTGGALGRMSIFALNIMPYITSSIIMQLGTMSIPYLGQIKKDGEVGRRRINKYTKYLTFLLALFQGYGIAVGAESMISSSGSLLVADPGLLFRITCMINLAAGTMIVMWFGEQISSRGIGNGSSMIIFAGIIAELPSAVVYLFEMARTGGYSIKMLIFIVITCLSLIAIVIFFEKSYRQLPVHYLRRQQGNKVYGAQTSHLPIKVNTSGVIPPIFASSLLLFPTTIVNILNSSKNNSLSEDQGRGVLDYIASMLAHGKPLYIAFYILLIVFFAFFYAQIVLNPEDVSENLRKSNAIIPGRRPGPQTAHYIIHVLNRVNVIGAIYISFICIIPELLMSEFSIPFYLGGTSILIVVNVILELFNHFQTYYISNQYQNIMKKNKLAR